MCFLTTYELKAQDQQQNKGYMVKVCVYKGDTIPYITLRNVYVYPKMRFKNKKQERYYYKLVRDVKKTLPIAKEIRGIVIETYEYLETLPNEEAKEKHIKAVEKGLKEQYTPRMKKLYQLVKAFMGPFKAGFYQTFAALFGASLKKEYKPKDEDEMVERIITLVENGQL